MRRRPYKKLQERISQLSDELLELGEQCFKDAPKRYWQKFRATTRKYNRSVDCLVDVIIHNLTFDLSDEKLYDIYSFRNSPLRKDRAIIGHMDDESINLNEIKQVIHRILSYPTKLNEMIVTSNIIIEKNYVKFMVETWLIDCFQIVEAGQTNGLLYSLHPPQDLISTDGIQRKRWGNHESPI